MKNLHQVFIFLIFKNIIFHLKNLKKPNNFKISKFSKFFAISYDDLPVPSICKMLSFLYFNNIFIKSILFDNVNNCKRLHFLFYFIYLHKYSQVPLLFRKYFYFFFPILILYFYFTIFL
jgi:hypothetical protein